MVWCFCPRVVSDRRLTYPATDVVPPIRIEHPYGAIDVHVETGRGGAELGVRRAGIVLSARKIMDGQVFVPERLCP